MENIDSCVYISIVLFLKFGTSPAPHIKRQATYLIEVYMTNLT